MNNSIFPNIQGEGTMRAAQRLSTITHNLRKSVIKIEQLKPAYRKVQGVIDVKVYENRDYERNGKPRFRSDIIGNSGLKFAEDPYPTDQPQGTGLVMYLLDDDELVPKNAKSGASRGWNREFLASNLSAGWFRVCDETILKDIKKRAAKISAKLDDEEPERKLIAERMELILRLT